MPPRRRGKAGAASRAAKSTTTTTTTTNNVINKEEKRPTSTRGTNRTTSRKKLKPSTPVEEQDQPMKIDEVEQSTTTVKKATVKKTATKKTTAPTTKSKQNTKKKESSANGSRNIKSGTGEGVGTSSKVKRNAVQPEYDEIWKKIYLAGTEWDQMKQVYSIDWDFDHLDEALTYGDLSSLIENSKKQVYLFGATEPQLVMMDENDKKGDVVPIPTIIAIVSEIKPPSQVGIKSVQRAEEEIVPMSDLKIEWQPFIPDNIKQTSRFRPNVFILGCSQRHARLRNMKEDAVHRYDYVLPYFFDPTKQEEIIEETEIQVLADLQDIQAPVMCEFDYELDDIEEFVEEQIEDREDLDSEKHKIPLKKAIEDAVKVAKDKYRREKQERQKRLDSITSEEKEAIKNTKLIKFYPRNDWPDISPYKSSSYINRYYGKASELRDDIPEEDNADESEAKE